MGFNNNDDHNAKPQVDIRPDRGNVDILADKNIAFSAVFHAVLGIIA